MIGEARGGPYSAEEVTDEDDQVSVRIDVLDEGFEGGFVARGVEDEERIGLV